MQIIAPEWLITMAEDSEQLWLENHALVIDKDKILAIKPAEQARETFPEASFEALPGHALLPGFINAHAHAAMNLLRGISDDLPLKEWLENAIWPVEAKLVDDNFVRQGTELAIAEMLRSGTTCFQDMYFMPDQAAAAVIDSGIRANIGLVVIDFPTAWARDAQEHIDKGLTVYDEFKNQPRLNFNLAPHAPYTVSLPTLERIITLSNELDLNIQMHIHETATEVDDYFAEHGLRPLTALKSIGMLTPQLNAVHMTQLNEGEMDWLAETGVHVVHCPQSNMKLASGACMTPMLLQRNVNMALGTDGAASNNDLNMLAEMQSAALLGKVDTLNPTAVTAWQALTMATLGGAKALGLASVTGSLEVGKQADMIAIDLNRIETMPVYNPVSQIVYSASREQVRHVWVAGEKLLNDRQLTRLDEQRLLRNACQWKDRVRQLVNA